MRIFLKIGKFWADSPANRLILPQRPDDIKYSGEAYAQFLIDWDRVKGIK